MRMRKYLKVTINFNLSIGSYRLLEYFDFFVHKGKRKWEGEREEGWGGEREGCKKKEEKGAVMAWRGGGRNIKLNYKYYSRYHSLFTSVNIRKLTFSFRIPWKDHASYFIFLSQVGETTRIPIHDNVWMFHTLFPQQSNIVTSCCRHVTGNTTISPSNQHTITQQCWCWQ